MGAVLSVRAFVLLLIQSWELCSLPNHTTADLNFFVLQLNNTINYMPLPITGLWMIKNSSPLCLLCSILLSTPSCKHMCKQHTWLSPIAFLPSLSGCCCAGIYKILKLLNMFYWIHALFFQYMPGVQFYFSRIYQEQIHVWVDCPFTIPI